MLTVVASALLCGNRGCKAIAEWLHDLPVDIWHWMGCTRRSPKQDAFRKLLMRLDPACLEEVLSRWIEEVLNLELTNDDLSAVCIDGKTLCGTLRSHQRAVHLLAAVDHKTGCVLSVLLHATRRRNVATCDTSSQCCHMRHAVTISAASTRRPTNTKRPGVAQGAGPRRPCDRR